MSGERITRLEIENVKRIKAAVVVPDADDSLVIVRGENAQGKSSVLDSIEYAFAGAGSHPPKVIREGEKMARVLVETTSLVVTRRWVEGAEKTTTEVEVRAKDGTKLPSPQKVLDKMFDELAFDALEFATLKGKEQQELMKKLVPEADTTAIEAQRAKVFGERTLVGRDLDATKARLVAMPAEPPPPLADTEALLREQAEAQRLQQACSAAVQERAAALRRMADAAEAVRVSEMALAQAHTRHQLAVSQAAKADNAAEAAEDAAEGTPAVLRRVRDALAAATANAAANARWQERARLVTDLAALEQEHGAKTRTISDLDERKQSVLAAAKFPVEGLGLTPEGVTYRGANTAAPMPFEQASQAEQLRVSVAIGAARNPKLRVMTVREGSRLDKRGLKLLAELAKERDLQVWLECVGEEGPATVVIVDGAVRP